MRSIITAVALVLAPFGAAQTILDVTSADRDFDTLIGAVQAAGLGELLASDGRFTLFAPTDEAFAKTPAATLDTILGDRVLLAAVLSYHLVAAEATLEQLAGAESARTVQGESVTLSTSGGTVRVNGATVIESDVSPSNGIVHAIDKLILPPSLTAASTDSVVLPVASVADSGVTGTITLDRLGTSVVVTLALKGTQVAGMHPAHLHRGNCSAPGPVAIPLNHVGGSTGLSVTDADVSIAEVLTRNHSVVVHLAPDRMRTIVACGEVGAGAPGL